ncbi:MAG: glycosyltransferase [Pseudomonadota bacterium]
MSTRVSVVLPTYNRAADVERALRSVLAQTFTDWEVLVVDNHSTDSTSDVVASFRDARIRLLEVRNEGVVARSRNLGIHAATGEFVALLDSDDWWAPHKLAASVSALERGADVVYHDLYLVHHAAQQFFWRRARTRQLSKPVHDDLVRRGNALTNSSVVLRRSLFLDIGGISEDRALIAFEDYDAWLRIARITDRFTRLDRALGYYWKGGANLSTPERTLRNLEHFVATHFTGEEWRDGKLPGWVDYAYGRAYYHLRSPDRSRTYSRRALYGQIGWRKRVKAILTLAALSLGGGRPTP